MLRDGVRLHHVTYGPEHGPPVVIVPGITSPAITWEFVAEPLAVIGLRVVTLDLRGRGLSDAPASGYALTDYAADLAAVTAALGVEDALLVGHSLGARIATVAGVLTPAPWRAVVVADPPLSGPGRSSYPVPLEMFQAQLRAARVGTTAAEVLSAFPRWSEREAAIRAEWLDTCAEHAVVESWRRFHEEDFFSWWRRLRVPAMFVYGADSEVVSSAGAAEVAAANPAAEVRAIDRAGHMIPWENLDGFLRAVREAHAWTTGRRSR